MIAGDGDHPSVSPAPPLPRGVELRLRRARERIDRVGEITAEMVDLCLGGADQSGLVHRWMVVAEEPLPDDLPLVVADAVHDLRSALDPAIYDAAGGDGLADEDARRLMFPVTAKPAKLRDAIKSMPSLPSAAAGVIRSVQPWAMHRERKTHPLTVVTQLDNLAKHRHLNVAASAVGSVNVPVAPGVIESVTASMGIIPLEGREILVVRFRQPTPFNPENVQPYAINLVLADLPISSPAIDVLEDSCALIEETTRRLADAGVRR